MKKTLFLAIATLGILTFGILTSCQEEDFDVSTAVLQERAFEQAFIKEFGKPSANQSWDFYAQQMQSLRQEAGMTRGTQEITIEIDKTISQPTDEYFIDIVQNIGFALEEYINNSNVGQNNYTLTSTGDFKIYAVRYAGAIETTQTRDNQNEPYYYNLDFGLAYYGEDGQRVLVPLFGPGFKSGYSGAGDGDGNDNYGNPGWAAEVKIPKGMSFHFYLRYTYPFAAGSMNGQQYNKHYQQEIFYSNESPTFIQMNGEPQVFDDFGGASTLLYSTDNIDPVTGKDEQVMMIGFEDAWGHGPYGGPAVGNGTKNGWFDKDFNDVVFLIEGELPVPTAKRFFTEDKTSHDWDYNDVVFDVSNTGIVLRAVGGTLPVFLRVTDRLGNVTTTKELHELMREIQPQTSKRTFELTFTREEYGVTKTYYKPIDVAAFEISGTQMIWFDAVQIIRWISLGTSTQNTRLEEGEVERFANPLLSATAEEEAKRRIGNVELIVLPEYQESYDLEAISQLSALTSLSEDNTNKGPKIIQMTEIGGIPAMWSGPVSINWMKELQKITKGYSNFYGGGTAAADGSHMWWETELNSDYWYQYDGDYVIPSSSTNP